MSKKFGPVVAVLLAVALVGLGSYSVAGEGSCCPSKSVQKASNSQSTSNAVQKASSDASQSAVKANTAARPTGAAQASCAATCSVSGAKASAERVPAAKTAGACCAAGVKSASTSSACCAVGAKNAAAAPSSGASTVKSGSASNPSCSVICGTMGASKASCSSVCGTKGASKASYAANVYKVDKGVMYAVADGKRFVVTDKTPYTQVGNARYYFADESCAIGCQTKMANLSEKYNREALALATAEANSMTKGDKKYAVCSVSGKEFEITGATPALMIDGRKTYFCGPGCASNCAGKGSM